MRRFIFTTTLAVAITICHLQTFAFAEYVGEDPQIIGKARTDKQDATMWSQGKTVSLTINPHLIVKGDMLNIYDKNKNLAGRLVVTSATGEPVTGRVLTISRELSDEALIGFYLGENIQLNWTVPFIRNVADIFLETPNRLKVAVVDVVNEFGDRTMAGDKIAEEIRLYICARPQFDCAPQNLVEEILWRHNATTSRSITQNIKRAMQSELGLNLLVTGHIKQVDNETMDIALLAVHVKTKPQQTQAWSRFSFHTSERGITNDELQSITTVFHKPAKSRFTARLVSIDETKGMRAEYVTYRDLSALIEKEGGDTVLAGNFFLTIDGIDQTLSADGLFFDGQVFAGTHHISMGYYPVVIKNGKRFIQKEAPVQQSFKIVTGENENFCLDIAGEVQGEHSLLAGDIYILKEAKN